MEIKKAPKSANFRCELCDLICYKLSDYKRHVKTIKHIHRHNGNDLETKKAPKNNQFICICGKQLSTNSGLWKHKKVCKHRIDTTNDTINNNNIITMLIKDNNEFKSVIMEFMKKGTNNTIITNSNNNSFNLQFFLNETCKDALNISDFVNQLQVGIKDLESTGRLGYVEGISKIFINGLKQLDINQRPVHCSDSKRETIYIKDSNKWSKETDENIVLTNAIRDVAHKNIQQIPIWTEEHPEHKDLSSKYNDKYMKLVSEAMPGSTKEESDKNYKKIARNIMKETIIDK